MGIAVGAAGPGTAEAGRATDVREREQTLPVLPALAPLFPHGALRRGSTVVVGGSTSLLIALLAGASAAGSWCAVVGLPAFGAVAAAEAGIALERLALVPAPGPDWPTVAGALLDALDLVAIAPGARVRAADARRLAARARQRGAVLLPFGVPPGGWEGADLRLSLAGADWTGLGAGWGHLAGRRALVRAEGRGGRPRQARVWLPHESAGITPADEVAPVLPLTPLTASPDNPTTASPNNLTPLAAAPNNPTPLAAAPNNPTPLAAAPNNPTPLAAAPNNPTPLAAAPDNPTPLAAAPQAHTPPGAAPQTHSPQAGGAPGRALPDRAGRIGPDQAGADRVGADRPGLPSRPGPAALPAAAGLPTSGAPPGRSAPSDPAGRPAPAAATLPLPPADTAAPAGRPTPATPVLVGTGAR
jgi:hypothetical protein